MKTVSKLLNAIIFLCTQKLTYKYKMLPTHLPPLPPLGEMPDSNGCEK